jgi:sialic acid synthase SpsE
MSAIWQDILVAVAALAAGTWLLGRWLLKRRSSAGCDHCAAAYLKTTKRPAETASKVSTR